jgi:hypothetical protein
MVGELAGLRLRRACAALLAMPRSRQSIRSEQLFG